MKEQSILGATESRPVWESLETFARQGIQRLLQQLLEEEVEQVLGRARYERRDGMDATPGYRNGFGKPRRLSAMAGTITVRRPRVRGLEARFESRLLPLFKRRTEQVGRLLPELYLHGLAQGDFDLALRGLLGEAAPLSAPSIARLKAGCQAEYEMWKRRRLDDLEPVYVWADGIYVKAGLEKDKAAMLVVIAALRDGRKIVLAVESGYRESTESWAALLRDLKARGLRAPRLLIADGHLGIWGAVGSVFPTVREQRCWNHHLVNVLDTLPKTLQGRGPGVAHEDPLRGHAGGGGAAQAGVSGVGHEEGRGPGEPPARGGLGAVGDLLRLPEGALETPA
jgi:putative transposase